ncbi:MAG: NADH:ubiquinone reductase (Na(+)-transporting) subunit F [Bacteroidales bacterium]|nr:NADH:ubiquinone reductase (Na(+)-transporting) subunit F [Bacteroidales bacterium]
MNLTVILALAVFLTLMLLLVVMLLFVKTSVTPSEKVSIRVNSGYRTVEVEQGDTLSATLVQEQIFLPSACGGKGNCGQCRCRIVEGGGDILPTERGFFTPRQIADKWRLACQVKVSGDMSVLVPEAVLSAKMLTCEVVYNKSVSKYFKEICIKIPDGEYFNYHCGEYILVYAPVGTVNFADIEIDKQYKWDWKEENLYSLQMVCREETSRAYTVFSYPGEQVVEGANTLKLLVKIALPPKGWSHPGICSSYLFSLRPGDKVRIAGPYGEVLLPENAPADQEFVYVGGGAGISLMRTHIFTLLKSLGSTRKITFYYGARSYAEAIYADDFAALARKYPNFTFRLVLDVPDMAAIMNGVDFAQGYVHQALHDEYLAVHEAPASCLYFLCGPQAMVRATKEMLHSAGVPEESVLCDDIEEVE